MKRRFGDFVKIIKTATDWISKFHTIKTQFEPDWNKWKSKLCVIHLHDKEMGKNCLRKKNKPTKLVQTNKYTLQFGNKNK